MNEPNEQADQPAGLPTGSRFQRVAFAAGPGPGQAVLFAFPPPVNRLAVAAGGEGLGDRPAGSELAGSGPPAKGSQPPGEFLLVLSVPAPAEEDVELIDRLRAWADEGANVGPASQVLTLQGAQVLWATGRVAVLAAPDRLEAVRNAAVEVAYYDAELRCLERELGALWPHLEADAPLAYEFNEKAVPGRARQAERFRAVLALRARLARITPHVLCPFAHPPTLASQVGERLRERTRLAHRVESVGGQLEVFERVYEGCGQRASDFMLARTGHTLEWVIIVLLLTQTILVAVDILSGLRR